MDVLTFPRTVARGFVPPPRVRRPAHEAHGVATASVRGAVVHRRRGDVAVPHGRGTVRWRVWRFVVADVRETRVSDSPSNQISRLRAYFFL